MPQYVVSNFDTIMRYKLCTTIHINIITKLLSAKGVHIFQTTARRETQIFRCNYCIKYFSDTLCMLLFMSRSNILGVTHLRVVALSFSSALRLDTLSCLVLRSFGISVGVRVASCCRVFFSVVGETHSN